MTQCRRLSLCVLGGRRHVIHAVEAVDGLPVREDVFRAPDPRMRAKLGVKRVASLDGGQLRCLAGRRMIGVDISAGGVYTIRRRFWRGYFRMRFRREGSFADYLLFFYIKKIIQIRFPIRIISNQKRPAVDRVVVYGFFAFRTGTANMEQLHRSSPSAVYVRAVGIHQPRQVRIFRAAAHVLCVDSLYIL